MYGYVESVEFRLSSIQNLIVAGDGFQKCGRERSVEALINLDVENGDCVTLLRRLVGLRFRHALDEALAPELAEVITELAQTVMGIAERSLHIRQQVTGAKTSLADEVGEAGDGVQHGDQAWIINAHAGHAPAVSGRTGPAQLLQLTTVHIRGQDI